MAYDFPASPSTGTVFAPPGGPSWTWNGTVWLQIAPSGVVPEAPLDGQNYVRQNGLWQPSPNTAETYNRLINGGLLISQENANTGSSATGYYAADQWSGNYNVAGASVARSQGAGVGNYYQIGMTFGTAKPSLAAGDLGYFEQRMEGLRIVDLSWGTASAKPVVLRFETYANVTGTFGVAIRNATSAVSWTGSFTIPTANVWTPVTLVIPGATTGTWPVDNTLSAMLDFTYVSGTTYISPAAGWNSGNFVAPPGITNGTAAAGTNVYIRNIGLYADPQGTGKAPAWQAPDFGIEKMMCQRYWYQIPTSIISTYGGGAAVTVYAEAFWKQTMRAAPSVVTSAVTYSNMSALNVQAITADGAQVMATTGTTVGTAWCVHTLTINARM